MRFFMGGSLFVRRSVGMGMCRGGFLCWGWLQWVVV